MKIFFSYPHDDNMPLVLRIKTDLEALGHIVWFDTNKIKSGDEWRNAITRGILDSQQVVAFLSAHSVRDPGVCLNEIAIAMADKGEAMVTVLVEPEKSVNAPVSVTHIQWLCMEDWKVQSGDAGWYKVRFDEIISAIENPSHAGRNEELETLRLALDPMSFYAEIAQHIPGFTGRGWLVDRFKTWLADDPDSRVLRIEGSPGLGKTALASYLAHSAKSSVLAIHMCQYNKGESRNPLRLVRTLAYQLATRLPDYRARLLKTVAIQRPDSMQGKDAASLWAEIISAPLSGSGDGLIGRQRLAIIVDGLDEALVDGRNPIVELLVAEINSLPKWLGLVLTGRPDPELTQRLARYLPVVLRDDDPKNIADLKVYVDGWLAKEVAANRLTASQAKAASTVLLEKSQGAFLYLRQARNAVVENMLDLTQPSTFPSGLTEIYQRFFERRFSDASGEQSSYRTLVRPLLEFVLASPEPLPLDLAQELLGWDADGDDMQDDAMRYLGSLLKRSGKPEQASACTLAPFHNSVREWLGSEAAGVFRVRSKKAALALSKAAWRRFLLRHEDDTFAWQVLPELLAGLDTAQQEDIFGPPNWDISQTLFRLAESMGPSLRFTESAFLWQMHANYSLRLGSTAPEDTKFAGNQFLGCLRLGGALAILGKTEETLRCYHQGFQIAEDLNRREPENQEFTWDLSFGCEKLGDVLASLGRAEEALAYHKRSLKLATDLSHSDPENLGFARDLSICFNKLGVTLASMGRSGEAIDLFQRSLQIREDLAARDPHNVLYARDLSVCCHNLGDSMVTAARPREALAHFQRSLQIREDLCERFPDSVEAARDLAEVYGRLGSTLLSMGCADEALDYYKRALTTTEELSARAPENTEYKRNLSVASAKIGDALVELGCSAEPLEYYQRSLAIAQDLRALSPQSSDFSRLVYVNFTSLGIALAKLGRHEEALDNFRQCLPIAEGLRVLAPENINFANDLACSFERLGDTLLNLERADEALGYFQNNLKMARALNASAPESAKFARSMWASFSRLGSTMASLGHTDDAMECFVGCLKIAKELSASFPENVEYAHGILMCSKQLADELESQGHADEALRYQRWGLGIAEEALARTPDNTVLARNVFIASIQLGNTLTEMGLAADALGSYQRSLEMLEHPADQAQAGTTSVRDLSICYEVLGATLTRLGRTQEALDFYLHNLEITQDFSARAPQDTALARNVLVSFNQVAGALSSLNRTTEALGFYHRSVQLATGLVARLPENAQFTYDLRVSLKQANDTLISLEQRGDELVKLGRAGEAVGIYRQCLNVRGRLGEERAAGDPEFASYLSYRTQLLGAALVSLGRFDEALACYQQNLQIAQDISAHAPENSEFKRSLCSALIRIGDTLRSLERIDEALAYYQRSVLLAEALSAAAPDNAQLKRSLWLTYWNVAEICDGDVGLQWMRKAHTVMVDMLERGVLPEDDRRNLEHASVLLGVN